MTKPFWIPYISHRGERNYYPDLLIEYIDGSKELVEIKPRFLLKDTDTQLKLLAATRWSLENSVPFSIWSDEVFANAT